MKRKIIEITAQNCAEGEEGGIVALADDGTLWVGFTQRVTLDIRTNKFEYRFIWTELPGLPDDNGNLTKVR